MNPPFLSEAADGVRLRLKVQPRASRDEFRGVAGDELRVRLRASPVDDAANAALVRLLAQRLGCPRAGIRLLRGRASRHKTVLVSGVPPRDVLRRLGCSHDLFQSIEVFESGELRLGWPADFRTDQVRRGQHGQPVSRQG